MGKGGVKRWLQSTIKNVALISEYGRFDDLMCLMGTASQKEVINIIRKQLEKDKEALTQRENGVLDAHISLLAKWMPSINASSVRTHVQIYNTTSFAVILPALNIYFHSYTLLHTC